MSLDLAVAVGSASPSPGYERIMAPRGTNAPTRIAVVVSGWPRVSETFAANELLALQSAGMLAGVFATKPGDASLKQPQCDAIGAVPVLSMGDARAQGTALAERLASSNVTAVHGYFAHQPAAVAQVAANILGVRFGFSVHALDARKVEPSALRERALAAACVIACNRDVADVLRSVGAEPSLTPHGVDLARFVPRIPTDAAPELIAVGRLEKKGFSVLLDALARMRTPACLRIVGDGPLRGDLEALINRLGLDDRVDLFGRVTHDELPGLIAASQVVVVPSVVDSAGDRDGLPNVVLEAMASGRPIVASDVAAISTAVEHGRTGLLVPPSNPAALAGALDALAANQGVREAFGVAGRTRAEQLFDLRKCSQHFCSLLERAYG
jgi:glycosyltransferase involved in cell wall biosynthesis